MMTTSKTFGISNNQIPQQIINEIAPPITSVTPVLNETIADNNPLLKEYIEKYLKGEITAKQLDQIKKTLLG